jgi:hypothetical protein
MDQLNPGEPGSFTDGLVIYHTGFQNMGLLVSLAVSMPVIIRGFRDPSAPYDPLNQAVYMGISSILLVTALTVGYFLRTDLGRYTDHKMMKWRSLLDIVMTLLGVVVVYGSTAGAMHLLQ